ncbi:MAG TPA: hypothetical protein VJZ76_14660 [Thermoanaerobaculia bacterium]|nr:hypothetical protein [Thermoanaerobaculia bacterium]
MIAALLFAAAAATSTVPTAQIALDARVIDRVAEVSKRDLPRDLLRRMVEEDIELLRGKRPDGTYAYATYDRMEASRKEQDFSIEDAKKSARLEMRGAWIYRLIITSPARKLLVTHNRHVFIERVEIEYLPAGSTSSKVQTLDVNGWIEPGTSRNVDLNEVARQATARVYVHADPEGYGNIELALLEAKIFDNPDSPYADAVASAKAILRGLDNNDVPSIRAMAQRMANGLQPTAPAAASVDVIAPRTEPTPASTAAPAPDIAAELQSIEDLLTGTEAERRQGLDKLHQLLRRLRR